MLDNQRLGILGAFIFVTAGIVLAGSGVLSVRSDRDNEAYQQKVNIQLAQVLRQYIQNTEYLTFQFIANPELKKTLEAYSESSEMYQIAVFNQVFSTFLESQIRSQPLLRDAVFFDFKEPRRKPLTMSEDLSLEVLNAIRTSAFFEQAVEMDGRFQWEIRKILERNGKRSILCGRLIKRTDGERNLGVIALLLRTERFAEIINNDLYVDGEPSEGAVGNYYNLMISREGFILASPIKHHTGRHISEVMGKTKILAEALSSGRITGVFKADWKDGSVYLRIQPVHDSGILLLEVSTRPVGSILSLLSILVGAVLLAAGGGLAYRSRLIALPPESIGDGPSVSEEDLKHFKALPRRESEILLLISEGLSNKEIAYRLQLREQTVKNYIRSIYEKLGIHDRVSAALLISKIKNIRKIINNPE